LAVTRYSLLRGFCARINHPCIAPHPSALPTLLQYHCTSIPQYTTPPPTSLLNAIHDTVLALAISCKGQDGMVPWNPGGPPRCETDSSSDSASHTHFREDALVRALCPVALRAGLLRAAWRTALCAWRWRKAGSFLPHSSFVFSKRKLQKMCVGRWGPVSL